MKDTQNANKEQMASDDLLPEYDFDYGTSRPNRFAIATNARIITLDPDVAAVFTTTESVNAVLRALITTMPQTTTR